MEFVEPIRDKKKIDAMKVILADDRFGDRNVLLFTLGINTAYRISDLRTLKLEDVLEISRNKVIARERLAMKEKKTGKNNSVFISKKLRKRIEKYTLDHFPEELATRNFNRYLFPSQKGVDQPLSRVSLWRILSNAADRVGLTSIGTHSMRKTFGYFMYKNKTDLTLIQDLLNHSSQRETLRYIGITQEEKDTAVRSLDL
ncbi:tyrosine-type recombinase/integrase [Enterococcus sp. AZ072]|uniref:tyrosine-type recombinase/integrase n=1 Tax=unclassified Enterococcus TaxID=2608891 RepID=UPI003D28654A